MYGKPQPIPVTRTFFCKDCSNQFRDPRVQSVLDYPPPHSAPLFWLVSRKPCMESPNQYLSPEPFFARIAPTSFEIQGSKVCSTIRPLPLRHCFGWFQGKHVWKAPTSTFHQKLLLQGLLQPVSRSKGPKCARLSAPSLCATVLVGFKETMYGKPQPVPFTRTFFCQDCSNQFQDLRVQSVLDYPPPATGTTSTSWAVRGRLAGGVEKHRKGPLSQALPKSWKLERLAEVWGRCGGACAGSNDRNWGLCGGGAD